MILKYNCTITKVTYDRDYLELHYVDDYGQSGILHLTSDEAAMISQHFNDEVRAFDRRVNPRGGFSGVFVALSGVLPKKKFELALEFK